METLPAIYDETGMPLEPENGQEEEEVEDAEALSGPETEGAEDREGMDGEDKAPGMSAFRRSKLPHLPAVEAHLVDPSIVTDECCNICGVGLRRRQAGVADGEQPGGEEEDGAGALDEDYDTHVRGTLHAHNYTLHRSFREKFDGGYTGMVQELAELLRRCELTQAPTLTRLVDDMHDALDKYERKMAERQSSLKWRQGLSLIDKATDDFQTLLSRGNREYQKFRSDHPGMVAKEEGGRVREDNAGDSDTEFHAEMNRAVEEIEDNFKLKLRSEEGKIESRARKRKKKRNK
jgi:hypothetical protein